MDMDRRTIITGAAAAAVLPLGRARAQGTPTIKIGILNDQSGNYRDIVGPTGIACARQAIQEFTAAPCRLQRRGAGRRSPEQGGRGQRDRRAVVSTRTGWT